jgi:malonyl CoA-acyl carrier protein transacylase
MKNRFLLGLSLGVLAAAVVAQPFPMQEQAAMRT